MFFSNKAENITINKKMYKVNPSQNKHRPFASTSKTLCSLGSETLHFLIYLEMANKHRAPIMAALARTLLRGGHTVTIGCEPKFAYRFGLNPQVFVEDTMKHIKNSFSGDLKKNLRTLDVFVDGTADGLKQLICGEANGW